MKIRIISMFFTLLASLYFASISIANIDFNTISSLPTGEQYRQLSLMLLISAGADPKLVHSLNSISGEGKTARQFDPDRYKTPLARIVDQESMLRSAAILLKLTQQSHDEIIDKLKEINTKNPVLVSMVDINAISEDAIIIRNAIADSIGYSAISGHMDTQALLERYRMQTVRIRNLLEFQRFDKKLNQLTDEAIASVGGKLDAYQRMFDEEVDSKEFDRKFDAAQYIYNRSKKFDEKAGKLTEEVMKNVILSQSKVNPKPSTP